MQKRQQKFLKCHTSIISLLFVKSCLKYTIVLMLEDSLNNIHVLLCRATLRKITNEIEK